MRSALLLALCALTALAPAVQAAACDCDAPPAGREDGCCCCGAEGGCDCGCGGAGERDAFSADCVCKHTQPQSQAPGAEPLAEPLAALPQLDADLPAASCPAIAASARGEARPGSFRPLLV